MRVKYEFSSDKNILTPYFYNEGLQALIYKHLFPDERRFLHEEGFPYEKRKFKLFTFSRLLRKPKIIKEKKIFNFGKKISFVLSSPLTWILEDTAENLIKTDRIQLFNNTLYLESINIMPKKDFNVANRVAFKTLSPITVYSTFVGEDKPFYYYSPLDSEFFIQIINNLKKKFFVFYRKNYEGPLRVRILKFDKVTSKKVVWFKKRPITAWDVLLEIEAEREMLYLAYYAGIGAKNSAGFGCIEEVNYVRSN